MDRGALQATVHGVALSRTERPTLSLFTAMSRGGRCLSSLESHPLPPTLNTFPFKIGTNQVNFSLNFTEHFYILVFRSSEIWPT